MLLLITQLRTMTGVTAEQMSDSQLQTFLASASEPVAGELLIPLPTVVSGQTQYLEYVSPGGGAFDSKHKLVGPGGATLTPATVDALTGRWTFAAHQDGPVYLYGTRYDLALAAALVLEARAAAESTSFDVSVDGQVLRRSQKAQALRELAQTYRMQARPRFVQVRRDDVVW